jgi:hypothetical protein
LALLEEQVLIRTAFEINPSFLSTHLAPPPQNTARVPVAAAAAAAAAAAVDADAIESVPEFAV